jgi:acetyl-CoA carboxylase biotin carboxyl carrier protein
MDSKKVKELIDLIEASGISEIELCEKDGSSIRIRKQGSELGTLTPQHFSVLTPPTVHPLPSTPPTTLSPNTAETTSTTPASHEHLVKSPMVGTFYRASSPTDKPFVEIGQSVKTGAVLGIVEAMKMLNQIETDYTGIIKRILVENGQPVEFGQPLFAISDA